MDSGATQHDGTAWASEVFPKLDELDALFGDGTAKRIKLHLITDLYRRAHRIGGEKFPDLQGFAAGVEKAAGEADRERKLRQLVTHTAITG